MNNKKIFMRLYCYKYIKRRGNQSSAHDHTSKLHDTPPSRSWGIVSTPKMWAEHGGFLSEGGPVGREGMGSDTAVTGPNTLLVRWSRSAPVVTCHVDSMYP